MLLVFLLIIGIGFSERQNYKQNKLILLQKELISIQNKNLELQDKIIILSTNFTSTR